MKVKYIRVSTEEQNIQRQHPGDKSFSKIYVDRISGAKKFQERPGAGKLLSDIYARVISEVHISSVDRLGRNILDILTVIDIFNTHKVRLYIENIGLYSLVNDKPNSVFSMIVSVLANIAEIELNNMRERQRDGIEIAKRKGVYTGRVKGSKMSDEELLQKYKTVVKELRRGESLRRAAKLGGCSLGTAQKIKKLL